MPGESSVESEGIVLLWPFALRSGKEIRKYILEIESGASGKIPFREVLESVLEPLSSSSGESGEISSRSEAVILLPLLSISDDLIGLIDPLEFLFGFLISFMLVWVPLHRKLPVGLLDLGFARIASDSEHLVIIFVRHIT